MARHRRVRRDIPGDVDDGGDVGMGDVTDATLPEAVPRNADGSASEEGEVSEEQAQLIGSLSLESAAKNRGVSRKLRDKALGKKGVAWNVDDALEMFSYVRTVFAAEWNSIIVHITRTEPAPRIQLPPIPAVNLKDSQGLYEYVDRHHGTQGPATYKVYWRAGAGHERGVASIYMPDKSAPPVVQVLSQPQQQQPQQPQYAPQQYAQPYQSPYPSSGGGPLGQQGYWPQQQQPQQQPQDRIVVISPPAAPQQTQAPQQAAPAPPPPQPIYMPPPAAAPGSFDPQRAMFEMMQAQSAQMMATLEKVVERLNKPQPPPPPPGFIAIPDGYPLPPGYFRVPGGMLPAPTPAMYAPQPQAAAQPMGLGTTPAQPQPVAYAQQAPVVQQPQSVPLDQQIKGMTTMLRGVMGGMQEIQGMAQMFGAPAGGGGIGGDDQDIEPEPEAPNPIITQEVGGITMALDRASGKVQWPATLMGALPKVIDAAKGGLAEYRKAADHQAALTANAVQQRINLANAVRAAQQPMQQPALQQAPAQQQPAPPPRPAPAPAQAAPAPAPIPAPVKKPSVPMPNGPIWGS